MLSRHRSFESGCPRESGALCRLEPVVVAARLGTAWLPGDDIDRTRFAQIRNGHRDGLCRAPGDVYEQK